MNEARARGDASRARKIRARGAFYQWPEVGRSSTGSLMKAEFDKEIDSLLRREGARPGRASFGARGDGDAPAAHLDADEQSAYAENALPAAARAHYAAHLADCDDCRRSVTRLALATGMPAQLEQRETATGQAVVTNIGWRERLGALLAPRALRYAVPALALILVSAVALVVLMRKPSLDSASVAQHNTSEAQRAAPAAQTRAQTEAHHAPQNDDAAPADATPAGESAALAPVQNAPQANEEIAANSPREEAVSPLTRAPLNDAAAPPPPPASSTGGGVNARSASGLPTPAPMPAPVTDEVTVTSDEAKAKSSIPAPESRKLEQRQGGFDNRQYENRPREQVSGPHRSGNNEQARNARAANTADAQDRDDKRDGDFAATTTERAPAAAARRSTRREADRGRVDNSAAEDSESGAGRGMRSAETRTVAGRKFRRQGDAWVDTAFNAGQSYTVVRRNSEQFRALAADEPELRRIAGALGGDVTVVWKGRAYRIR